MRHSRAAVLAAGVLATGFLTTSALGQAPGGALGPVQAPGGALGPVQAPGGAPGQSTGTPVASPADQVEFRQMNMKRMGDAAKAIGRFVKNEGGTLDDVRAGAHAINDVSHRIVPELFPPGTAIGVGDSAAKPEIWQDQARFQATARALEEASGALVQAAASGDRATIVQRFGAVGRACSDCHDSFRQEKE